ncbi:hypothetical protein SAMN05216167_103169 [Spirosoma endophyticum]|uniref:Uncharacterized protein n=1 Tax=Spirosoma endophyticum TaxID=662367 RepID=A0A1I1P971_9BACT|nr:hypothetical protein SAMN05216167_103169 [Spirosoma endophyticum]
MVNPQLGSGDFGVTLEKQGFTLLTSLLKIS